MTIAEIVSPDGQAALKDVRVHLPALQRTFERYRVFGGLPAAVGEAVSGLTSPSEEVQRVLWDSLTKEVQRKGASMPAAQALLERVMRSLGSKVSWSRMAEEMAVPLGGMTRIGRAKPGNTERSAESMLSPERLHVWGTKSGGEIDFVCGPRDAIEAVEVADWDRLNRQKATAPMRALPRRPALVATRNQLEFGPTANLVPASILLWALSD